jgi:hypothetical protein
MTQPNDRTPATDYIQNALEATCDALMTLESIPASGETSRASGAASAASDLHVAQAIASLRHAISELRLAHAHEGSALALGFVMRPRSRRRPRSSSP